MHVCFLQCVLELLSDCASQDRGAPAKRRDHTCGDVNKRPTGLFNDSCSFISRNTSSKVDRKPPVHFVEFVDFVERQSAAG